MAAQESGPPPAWLRVGSKCRWWSESQKTCHPIVVTSVDTAKRRAVVHFEADHRVWKTVPFAHIGPGGLLRPPASEPAVAAADKPKAARAPPAQATIVATPVAWREEDAEKQDGTATPPWYEQIMVADNRERVKDDHKRKEEEVFAQKERRRTAWQSEMQKQAEEDKRLREEERRRREEAAEAERLRILQKLQHEREEEQRRRQELLLMEHEEEASARVNAVWRQREQVQRRQREEEERAEREEEERRRQAKLQEDLASRPRVSFGVAMKLGPQKLLPPEPRAPREAPREAPRKAPREGGPPARRWDRAEGHGCAEEQAKGYEEQAMGYEELGPQEYEEPGAQDYAGPGSQDYAAFGAQDYAAPDAQDYAAPDAQDYAAPGSQDYAAFGAQDYAAPDVQDYAAPDAQDYAAPGPQDYAAPGPQDYVAPGPQDCAAPGPPRREERGPAARWGAAASGVAEADADAEDAASPVEFYGARICRIYERCNPTKLADVPALLEKYAGCEAEMYGRICEKYGVAPEPLPAHLAAPRPSSSEEPRPVGYARKASAPAPPRPGSSGGPGAPRPAAPAAPAARGAPSASALMARFKSLVASEGGEGAGTEAVGGGPQEPAAGDESTRRRSRGVRATGTAGSQGREYELEADHYGAPYHRSQGSRSPALREHSAERSRGACGASPPEAWRGKPPHRAPAAPEAVRRPGGPRSEGPRAAASGSHQRARPADLGSERPDARDDRAAPFDDGAQHRGGHRGDAGVHHPGGAYSQSRERGDTAGYAPPAHGYEPAGAEGRHRSRGEHAHAAAREGDGHGRHRCRSRSRSAHRHHHHHHHHHKRNARGSSSRGQHDDGRCGSRGHRRGGY